MNSLLAAARARPAIRAGCLLALFGEERETEAESIRAAVGAVIVVEWFDDVLRALGVEKK